MPKRLSLPSQQLANLSEQSAADLLQLALTYAIIDDGNIDGGRVHISLGNQMLSLAEEEGKIFLRGLVRGYNRALYRE
jgi:hypothetical protein